MATNKDIKRDHHYATEDTPKVPTLFIQATSELADVLQAWTSQSSSHTRTRLWVLPAP